MAWQISFVGWIEQFPVVSGWPYVAVTEECTKDLNSQRRSWGMHPITVHVGHSKLMMKKGSDFFMSLK